jgi:hypothetical protein
MSIYFDTAGGFARRLTWGILFLISGLFAVFFDIGSYRGHDSKSWPVVEGTVVAYYQNPQYRYLVGGLTFENGQVTSLEFVGGSAGNVDVNLVKYPLHGKVTVHYNPQKPQLAVLDTRFEARYYTISAAISAVSMLFFVAFVQGWPRYIGFDFD